MRKRLLIALQAIFLSSFVHAQTTQPPRDLNTLLAERDKLYQDYQRYKDQKSSFWGTQSKSDLRQIIDVLKGIINKDTEIVEAVRVQGLRKESSYLGQSREITERVYNLNEEVQKLNVQLGQQQRKLSEAREELSEARQSSSRFKILSLMLTAIVAGLIFYIRKIR